MPPARYLFDRDFAAPDGRGPTPARPEPVPAIDPATHMARLAEAEAAGLERGRKEGREAAEATGAARLADEARRLAAAAQSILAVLDAERTRIEGDALRLAAAVAEKLAGAVLARFPHEAVLAALSDCLAPLRQAAHIVLRLAPDHVEPIRAEVDRLAAERGFAGRLVLVGEPGLAPGDCRIEWAEGGIVLDGAAVSTAVAAAIERHLALNPAPQAPAGA